jgi:hypothetical protein
VSKPSHGSYTPSDSPSGHRRPQYSIPHSEGRVSQHGTDNPPTLLDREGAISQAESHRDIVGAKVGGDQVQDAIAIQVPDRYGNGSAIHTKVYRQRLGEVRSCIIQAPRSR